MKEFGTILGDVYAYPNPALKNHQTVTTDGRNGIHLPKGTNIKILDVAGNLVASGIYIVLLSNDDASETAVTKIAIVN